MTMRLSLKNIFPYQKWIAVLCIASLLHGGVYPVVAFARPFDQLPKPGVMVNSSDAYFPPSLAGITIYPDNPLKFDFIIDTGEDQLSDELLHAESEKLIKYFMTTLTVPEKEMWVNLSPYEEDRIIAEGLGQTQMGIDMLGQDYILKQLTASMMYPEDELGADFWDRVYRQAQARFGTTDIPVNTYKKIWIIPEKASVYINGNSVFISNSRLKVMLEEDYLALDANAGRTDHGVGERPADESKTINSVTSQIVREILVPEIEREVNHGRNFALLRQIYHSMILATWYKKNLRESILGQVYVDRNRVSGIDTDDREAKYRIYEQYVEAFEEGVYNYVKEEFDVATQEVIPRKYFSGGKDFSGLAESVLTESVEPNQIRDAAQFVLVRSQTNPIGVDAESLLNVRDPSLLTTTGPSVAQYVTTEITVPTLEGAQEFAVVFPEYVSRDGETIALDPEQVRAELSGALSALSLDTSMFNLSLFTGIRIVDGDVATEIVNTPGVLDIPVSLVLPQVTEGVAVVNEEVATMADAMRVEHLKLVMLYEDGVARGLEPDQMEERNLRYLGGVAPTNREMPFYADAPQADYQVIMPVYNEADILDFILNKVKSAGYLGRLTVVNDASTDESRDILDRWAATEGLDVIHMETNQKKEGAIRRAMEIRAERLGRLPDKTILLDSDTFFDFDVAEGSLDQRIDQVSAYMEDKEIAGVSFRIDALLPENPNILEKTQYAEYVAIRMWNKILSTQGQLWVINGPAGMFRSEELLDTLQNMVPDFETGDLLITVNLMKRGMKVGYYPDVKAQTIIPNTASELFKQRRRWERGTTKVLVDDAGFYRAQFGKRRWLALQTLMHSAIYVGTAAGLLTLPFADSATDVLINFLAAFGINYGVWVGINSAMTLGERNVRREGDQLRLLRWFLVQGFVAPFVTIPARFTGFYDAVSGMIRGTARDPLADKADQKSVASERDQSLLTTEQNPGGIDFNADMLDLTTQGHGIQYDADVLMPDLQSLPVSGFTPIIIEIVPLGNLSIILGVQAVESSSGQLSAAR